MNHEKAARIHRAISYILDAEIELEVAGCDVASAQAAELRHSLYADLDLKESDFEATASP